MRPADALHPVELANAHAHRVARGGDAQPVGHHGAHEVAGAGDPGACAAAKAAIKLARKKQIGAPLQIGHRAQQGLPEARVDFGGALQSVDGVKAMELALRSKKLRQCWGRVGGGGACGTVAGQALQGLPHVQFGLGQGGVGGVLHSLHYPDTLQFCKRMRNLKFQLEL